VLADGGSFVIFGARSEAVLRDALHFDQENDRAGRADAFSGDRRKPGFWRPGAADLRTLRLLFFVYAIGNSLGLGRLRGAVGEAL